MIYFNKRAVAIQGLSAIDHLSGQTVAIVGYLEPLSSIIFAVVFLYEIMLPLQLLGAALILGGALASELIVNSTNPIIKQE